MALAFSSSLKIPDPWQQEALHALRAGRDVIVQAPTGSGKTHIFEMLVRSGWRKRAVYTVPTRALANDKRQEWRAQGLNVGIATGDIAENLDAPILVATLETQRGRFLAGRDLPDLLVIDEFQMLGDPARGVNYELVLALAGPRTQLLLLSGSVANPESVAHWLRSLGREVSLIHHSRRPVPLEEVFLDQLHERVPEGMRGHWPRLIARALLAGLGPILVFAPRRKAAEELARQLAAALPLNDLLSLSAAQKELAGQQLGKMLRSRIAYHHSGLSYAQRAELVEPLAKAGALRVVVATTGLAAGINFSMRSVLVTDREYQSGHETREIRPDELLQMFGRAGRRGLDERGAILVATGKPRLGEGRPLQLKRAPSLDWAGFLAVMHQADQAGIAPCAAAEDLAKRLFTQETPPLGLERLRLENDTDAGSEKTVTVRQMQAHNGTWERLRHETKKPIHAALLRIDDRWFPAGTRPETFQRIPLGSLGKFQDNGKTFYGRIAPLATFPRTENEHHLVLAKWLLHRLRVTEKNATAPPRHHPRHRARRHASNRPATPPPVSKLWTLEELTEKLLPRLRELTGGGVVFGEPFERNGTLFARLDYRDALVRVRVDADGTALINPRLRDHTMAALDLHATLSEPVGGGTLPGLLWQRLGLIDSQARLTRRGVIASFFHHCEGLAIAAALEDDTYAISELLRDLANLRAGHRFENLRTASNRLGACCSLAYRGATVPGHLREGLPLEYGAGAAETLAALEKNPAGAHNLTDEWLNLGDIERTRLEWQSLLNHIAHAPEYPWDRWLALQNAARRHLRKNEQ